jgi:hypothetical protein
MRHTPAQVARVCATIRENVRRDPTLLLAEHKKIIRQQLGIDVSESFLQRIFKRYVLHFM